ncbi:MAG: hypothetical protein QXF56_02900 [Candidatus Micrarchaeia archaeon]
MVNKVTVPVSLDLDENLAWCIGFYLAEGNKTKDYIGVSNCNVDLIKRFKMIMEEIFKIDKNLWRVHVKTSNKNLDDVKVRWKASLGLDVINVLYNRLAREDNIELRLNSRYFSEFFNRLLEEFSRRILKVRSLSLSFLEGYGVGDGSIIRRKGFLYGIAFTTKSEVNKDLIVKIFEAYYGKRPRVRVNKSCFEIEVCGVNLMTEFIIDGHFSSHKNKRRDFINSYLKKEYTRSHVRYWSALEDGPKGIFDLAKSVNRSHWSVREALSKDFKLGLVNILNKKPKIYGLSRKGKKLLDILGEVSV